MDIFPTLPGLTWDVKKTPTMRTLINEASGGQQYRVGMWQNPIFQFHLEYEFLRDKGWLNIQSTPYDELNTLEGFFLAQVGSQLDFLYKDPFDNGGTGLPLQMVTDQNGTVYSPLQVTIGASLPRPALVDVTDLVPAGLAGGATLNVYDNGVLKTLGADYAFDPTVEGLQIVITNPVTNLITDTETFEGLYVQWLVPPVGPVTADFKFYFRVHFGNYQGSQRQQPGQLDALELDNFINQLWEAKTVEFETSRAN